MMMNHSFVLDFTILAMLLVVHHTAVADALPIFGGGNEHSNQLNSMENMKELTSGRINVGRKLLRYRPFSQDCVSQRLYKRICMTYDGALYCVMKAYKTAKKCYY